MKRRLMRFASRGEGGQVQRRFVKDCYETGCETKWGSAVQWTAD